MKRLGRSRRTLKSCAAYISAMHCGTPWRKFSFFASTTAITGASMAKSSGERVTIQSQKPVSPREASTSNSAPENTASSPRRCRRTSRSTGAMIHSERAFSVA